MDLGFPAKKQKRMLMLEVTVQTKRKPATGYIDAITADMTRRSADPSLNSGSTTIDERTMKCIRCVGEWVEKLEERGQISTASSNDGNSGKPHVEVWHVGMFGFWAFKLGMSTV